MIPTLHINLLGGFQVVSGETLVSDIDYVRMLLTPQQQVLPDVLTANLEAATRAWDDDQPDVARKYLQQTIISVQESGYL